ncbi:hypothetical protein SDC9_198439 [bioreactor metagenome]|uniref:Uncharacterized protein n=1 Tax=bioreactor metagenome TaxID=1076179 RepID=A0A645II60_9ZZZZ
MDGLRSEYPHVLGMLLTGNHGFQAGKLADLLNRFTQIPLKHPVVLSIGHPGAIHYHGGYGAHAVDALATCLTFNQTRKQFSGIHGFHLDTNLFHQITFATPLRPGRYQFCMKFNLKRLVLLKFSSNAGCRFSV